MKKGCDGHKFRRITGTKLKQCTVCQKVVAEKQCDVPS